MKEKPQKIGIQIFAIMKKRNSKSLIRDNELALKIQKKKWQFSR